MGAFGTVIVVISVVAVVLAVVSFWGSGRIYQGLGRSGSLSMEGERGRPASTPAGASSAEAREEIRQMLEAKSAPARRAGSGRSTSRPSSPRSPGHHPAGRRAPRGGPPARGRPERAAAAPGQVAPRRRAGGRAAAP